MTRPHWTTRAPSSGRPRGRPHRSTLVVTLVAMLVLVFWNVPGKWVRQASLDPYSNAPTISHFEHGWPWTYLVRADEDRRRQMYGFDFGEADKDVPRTIHPYFQLRSGVQAFRPWSLAVNVGVVAGLVVALGAAFEVWRRQRNHIFQFHLRDLACAFVAVALLTAWCTRVKQRRAWEALPPGINIRSHQIGGPAWLRPSLGNDLFRLLDRPYVIEIVDERGWQQLERLPTVQVVYANLDFITSDKLALLAELPQLEALFLYGGRDFDGEFPSLPQLRRLDSAVWKSECRGINRLTSLEMLCLSADAFEAQTLREISTLPRLHQLELRGNFPDSIDFPLLAARPHLTALRLIDTQWPQKPSLLSDTTIANICQLTSLTALSISEYELPAGAMRQLSQLVNLKYLDLWMSRMQSEDREALWAFKRSRELPIDGQ